jgi:hypothetical protein
VIVAVPQRIHVVDLKGAFLFAIKVLAKSFGFVPVAFFAFLLSEEPLRLHHTIHGPVAGHRAQRGIFLHQCFEIVVMELITPSSVLVVLNKETFVKGLGHLRKRTGVRRHFASQLFDRIRCVFRFVIPPLDGGDSEAHRLLPCRMDPHSL